MTNQMIYRMGQLMSLVLWTLVVWSLFSSERDFFQQLVLWVGLATLAIHALEILAFSFMEPLKPHKSIRNMVLTLLFGGFHLKWLIDKDK